MKMNLTCSNYSNKRGMFTRNMPRAGTDLRATRFNTLFEDSFRGFVNQND